MSETNPQWADDLVADSDAALRRLCAAVQARTPDLDSPSIIAGSGEPSLAGPSVEQRASILDALGALRIAVVGAADLANAQTRAIVDTFSDDSDGWVPDSGALFRRGQQTLRRVSGDLPE